MTRYVLLIYLILDKLTPTFPTFKSLNLVECQEFRDLLLLLRSGLRESMIPRRTKVRELIIQAWKEYFQVLKLQLAVRTPWLIGFSSVMCSSFLGRDGPSFFHC
jgi:hypothetical protein